MVDYTKEIESNLRPLEAEVEAIFNNKEELHSEIFHNSEQTIGLRDSILKKLETLSDKTFGIYFYQNDSLVFWSKSNVLPNDLALAQSQSKGSNLSLIHI